jgi:hypothetical protein
MRIYLIDYRSQPLVLRGRAFYENPRQTHTHTHTHYSRVLHWEQTDSKSNATTHDYARKCFRQVKMVCKIQWCNAAGFPKYIYISFMENVNLLTTLHHSLYDVASTHSMWQDQAKSILQVLTAFDLLIFWSFDLLIFWSFDLLIFWSFDLLIFWSFDLGIRLETACVQGMPRNRDKSTWGQKNTNESNTIERCLNVWPQAVIYKVYRVDENLTQMLLCPIYCISSSQSHHFDTTKWTTY